MRMILAIGLGVAIDLCLIGIVATFVWLMTIAHANKYDVMIGALGFDAVALLAFLIVARIWG